MYAKTTLLIVTILCFWFTPEKSKSLYLESLQAKEIGIKTKTSTGEMEKRFQESLTMSGTQSKKNQTKQGIGGLNKENGGNTGTSKYKNPLIGTCDAECKMKTLNDIGISKELSRFLVNECKKVKEPVNCIKIGASILGAESSLGTRCYKFNCFGVTGVKLSSYEESVKDFTARWDKHWFNQKTPDSFYSNSPDWKPKTRYCMSESSSNSNGFCPNGHRHAWYIFNKLTF